MKEWHAHLSCVEARYAARAGGQAKLRTHRAQQGRWETKLVRARAFRHPHGGCRGASRRALMTCSDRAEAHEVWGACVLPFGHHSDAAGGSQDSARSILFFITKFKYWTLGFSVRVRNRPQSGR